MTTKTKDDKMKFDQAKKDDFKEGTDDEKSKHCDVCLAYGVMTNDTADEYSHYITKDHVSEAFGSLFNPPIKIHLCRCCYQEQPAV
jgi:hypothetical protein|tara:strand:- start:380 stop:637 length:258 start_codon:yes stop_codon:yes gene_type:complete